MDRGDILDVLDSILVEEYIDFDNTDYPDENEHYRKIEALNLLINIFDNMDDADFRKLKG